MKQTSIEVRKGGRLVYGINVEPEKFLAHCARIVARVRGYRDTGEDMLRSAGDNPRAVLKEIGLEVQSRA